MCVCVCVRVCTLTVKALSLPMLRKDDQRRRVCMLRNFILTSNLVGANSAVRSHTRLRSGTFMQFVDL